MHGVTAQQFQDTVVPAQRPVILRGLDLSPACQRWTPEYLQACPSGHQIVSAHVCTQPQGGSFSGNRALLKQACCQAACVPATSTRRRQDHKVYLCLVEAWYRMVPHGTS